MAAVVEFQHLEQAALPGHFTAGALLRRSGAVSEVEPGYGGACGVVGDPDGTEYEVWIGIAHGVLTAECDCPEAEAEADSAAPGMCAHGVALGIAALEQGLSWAPATHGKGDDDDAEERAEVDGAAALAALTPVEQGAVLAALLEAHPELRSDAESLALLALGTDDSA
ncbi:hypothetical protein [Streptacidiphilus albus]|uniref:hypothetical protein n=1 Tax=Streptacidiphilus albus TaxID=105425 RepID=UPI000A7375B1|nr:hypothetical protein [Streptacidiphilus albus]